MLRWLNEARRPRSPLLPTAINVRALIRADRAALASRRLGRFRSNQLLTFAKIGLSDTDAALDARDRTFSSRVLASSTPSVSACRPIARAPSSTFRPHSNE